MPNGRLFIEQGASPARALAAGGGLWTVLSPEQPVAIYATQLRGEALVLGRHQRVSQALNPDAARRRPVLRRASGGATVDVGDGVSYVALALRERSVLMACPPQRILNRNVRGALQGLRRAGVQANYFGRDFLSFEARPAVYVGWDAGQDGHVLLEFFVSERRSCWPDASFLGYPPRQEDPLRTRPPTTLEEAGAELTGPLMLEQFAHGYSTGYKVEWRSEKATNLSMPDLLPVPPREHPREFELTWSVPLEESIGFLSAGVALDAAGKFSQLVLAGDYFAHRACGETLERMLIGVTPSRELVGRAVDTAFAQPEHDFEGVRNLKSLQEVILDAADLAKRSLDVQ